MSLYLKWLYYIQHTIGSCFLAQWYSVLRLVHLAHWHLKWLFDTVGVIATIFIYITNSNSYYFLFVALVLCSYFCLPLFLPFCVLIELFFFSLLHSLQDCSSLTRDWTQALAVNVPSPNHWTTREFQKENILYYSIFLLSWNISYTSFFLISLVIAIKIAIFTYH